MRDSARHEILFVASIADTGLGPIIRITPREIHISDPSFYNEIYAGNNKRVDGDYRFTRSTGVTQSMFSAIEHDLHTARRSPLTKFFSKRSINNIQPIIQDKVERYIKKLRDARKDGGAVNLNVLSAAFTADTISHYAYGVSMGCLDGERENILTDATQAVLALSHWLKFMPIRFTNAKRLPPELVERFSAKAATVLRTHRTISELAMSVLHAAEPKAPHENMFAALADPRLPAEERNLGRLEDEGFVVLAAGTETTAYSLSVTMFYLLHNPDIHANLLEELTAIWPNPHECPDLSALENLPLLVRTPGVPYNCRTRLTTVSRPERRRKRGPPALNGYLDPPSSYCTRQSPAIQGLGNSCRRAYPFAHPKRRTLF